MAFVLVQDEAGGEDSYVKRSVKVTSKVKGHYVKRSVKVTSRVKGHLKLKGSFGLLNFINECQGRSFEVNGHFDSHLKDQGSF